MILEKIFLGFLTIVVLIIIIKLILPVGLRLKLYGFKQEDSYYNPDSQHEYHVIVKKGRVFSFTFVHDTVIDNRTVPVQFQFLLENRLASIVRLNYGGSDITCRVNLVTENQEDCQAYLSEDVISALKDKSIAIYLSIDEDFPEEKIPRYQIY